MLNREDSELCPSKNSHMVMVRVLGEGPSLLCGFEGDGIFVAFQASAGGQILYSVPVMTGGS